MKSILITAGGTEEPIDVIRSIGNFSSGRTGVYLADFFTNAGHSVTLLAHKNTWVSNSYLTEKYRYTEDLRKLLHKHLSTRKYHVIVHSSAVSDFYVKSISSQGISLNLRCSSKITSEQNLELLLYPNKKLISELRKYSKNKEILIIGFKLLNHPNESDVRTSIKKLFVTSPIDYVVYNDLSKIKGDQHKTWIYDSNQNLISKGETKKELAVHLESLIMG